MPIAKTGSAPTTTPADTCNPGPGSPGYIPANVLASAKKNDLGALTSVDTAPVQASFYFEKGSIVATNQYNKPVKDWPIEQVDITKGFKLPPFLGAMAKAIGAGDNAYGRVIKGNTVSYEFAAGKAVYTNGRFSSIEAQWNNTESVEIPANVANAAFNAKLGHFAGESQGMAGAYQFYFANGAVYTHYTADYPHTGPDTYAIDRVSLGSRPVGE